uniref:Uncharacterized protein n=1 Tax=Romanomermis culicivorax TaxID=13658 RepID=A0A915K0T2_ROMCU
MTEWEAPILKRFGLMCKKLNLPIALMASFIHQLLYLDRRENGAVETKAALGIQEPALQEHYANDTETATSVRMIPTLSFGPVE